MRCGLLFQLLGLWLYLSYVQAVPMQKLQDDAKFLIKTIINRIRNISHLQSVSSKHKVTGFDFIPLSPYLSLPKMDQTLTLYQKVITTLSSSHTAQISNDLENLQSLVQMMASSKGCPLPHTTEPELQDLESTLKESRYSIEVVVLRRMKRFLLEMLRQLELGIVC